MPGTDMLLMLSGGIDSAWCANTLLTQGHRLRTHHVRLHDREGRQDVEDEAAARVVAWLAARHGAHRVRHTRSTVSWGDLPHVTFNYYEWAKWAGVVLADPACKHISRIVIPRHADAFRAGPGGPEARRSDEAYTTIASCVARRPVTLVYPMVHLTKAQVVCSMPPGLLDLCWWCRRPKEGRPCHTCHTCRQVDPALAQLQPNSKQRQN